jgi:FtsZ-binding cell division protein ZapB
MNNNYMSLIGKLSQADDKSNKTTVLIALGLCAAGTAFLIYQRNQLLRKEIGELRAENNRYQGINATLISSNATLKQENSKLKNTSDRVIRENQQLKAELASFRKNSGNDNVS